MINPGSPLAVLFASLVVSASGGSSAMERAQPQKVTYLTASAKLSVRQAWVSAISNDNDHELLDILNQHPASSLSLLRLGASNGKSALMVAAKTGNWALAQLLVDSGAEIDQTTDTEGTAFMFAILGGDRQIARWFIEQGADFNKVGSNGWSAVTIAASKGNVSLLQWLISLGADAQVRDVYRFTPLMRAVDNGYAEAAAVLLSLAQTNVNAQDEVGNTSLHHAVSANHTEIVTLLLKHQADPSILNREGLSALDLALQNSGDSKRIFQLLDEVTSATQD